MLDRTVVSRMDLTHAVEQELSLRNRLLPRRWDYLALAGKSGAAADVVLSDKGWRGVRPLHVLTLTDRILYRGLVELIGRTLPENLRQRRPVSLDRGGRGALMRRKGLYSSLISEWRKQADRGALDALGKTRGRPPADPVERDNARLRAQVAKLQGELDTSRRVIEVQGKLSALLEQLATGGAIDEDRAK